VSRNDASALKAAQLADPGSTWGWFCLRSQPKHEHVAEMHLRQMGFPVLNPRVRFRRATKYGPVEVTEAMFPGYLFAQFDLTTSLPRVKYAPGVTAVVHFGQRWPKIPDEVIEALRIGQGAKGSRDLTSHLAPGDTVRIAHGALGGLDAVIMQVMPGSQRVLVLMDFLGRQTTVELQSSQIVKPKTAM
jgi:transcriptional antiterminator RfaH